MIIIKSNLITVSILKENIQFSVANFKSMLHKFQQLLQNSFLPALDFFELDIVAQQVLLIDDFEGEVDGRSASLEVEGRVEFGGHQDAHLVGLHGGFGADDGRRQCDAQQHVHRAPHPSAH